MKLPPKIPLARLPTPLQPLDRLSEHLGGPRIWLKRDDLTENIGGGNKLRKLEYVLADAKQHGATAVITSGGIQSNHCRATAFAAAKLGLHCHLILRGKPQTLADGNLLLDQLLGASIDYVNAKDFADLNACYYRAGERLREKGFQPYDIPIGASNDIGIWGYVEAAEEMICDFADAAIDPVALVLAVGSGGTYAGLQAGFSMRAHQSQLIGICVGDNNAFFEHKVNQDLSAWQTRYDVKLNLRPNKFYDQFIGQGYGVASAEIYSLIQKVAELEGVILDPVYTGKAMFGLTQLITSKDLEGDDIVFLHSGGTFGLFPKMNRQPLSELTQ